MAETEPQGQIILNNETKENIPPEPPPKPRLRALTAIIIFVLFVAGQILTGAAVIVFEGIKYSLIGGDLTDQAAVSKLIMDFMPQLTFACVTGGAIGLAVGSFIVKKSLRDNSSFGAAWFKGKFKMLLASFFLGACTALTYFVFSNILFPPSPDATVGPLAKMAGQRGIGTYTWVLIALFMAPLIEELLFRGVLLGGFTQSFGIWWGVFISNLLFVAVHFSEAIHYWPAFIGIGLLAVVATRQRLISQAIGPAIAAHFGYNLIIVTIALVASS